MQTETNIDQRRRSGLRLAAVLAVVAAGVTAVVLRVTLGGADDARAERGGLVGELDVRVVQLLEGATVEEHADHGHHIEDPDAIGLICEVETFGFAPAEAETVEQVEEAYVQHVCAEYGPGPGQTWPRAITASGPMLVTLGDPFEARLPDAYLGEPGGDTHQDRIRMLIPEEYHEEALVNDGYGVAELGDVLRERFEEIQG